MSLIDNEKKRLWRRGFRRHRRNALELGQQADQQIEKLLIKRFDRLISVRRFVFLWVLLFVLLFFCSVVQLRALSPYYQTLKPAPGGLYTEGLVGTFTNANPLYAVGAANVAVSRLVFSGLFKYDNKNTLVGDLAEKLSLDPSEKRYTISLKRGISWQDGAPFTADDVVFTYQTIQNIETQSSLYASWKDIKVTRQNAYSVIFELPNSLSSFPHALTNGIIPAHLLQKTPAQQLRSAPFNTEPIGTGPFVWKFVEVSGGSRIDRQQRISLEAFDDYWANRPKLDGFSIITFTDEQQLITAFKKKQINSMSGLELLPEELAQDRNIQTYSTPLSSAVMAFFNISKPTLNDVNVRRALISGVDRLSLAELSPNYARLVDSPLLRGQLAYDPGITQLPYDLGQADQLLNQAGWVRGSEGQRVKGGQPLMLSLSSQDTPQYTQVAQFLQQQYAKLGFNIKVNYYSGDDLQGAVIINHDYDILLYGISIGVDPDVFAYWHSSQVSVTSQGRLNLSEYKSSTADQALEAGRIRSDLGLRTIKYKPFLASWKQDAPALALYQPNALYISRGSIFNYERKAANSSADRFYGVHNWMIRQQRQDV